MKWRVKAFCQVYSQYPSWQFTAQNRRGFFFCFSYILNEILRYIEIWNEVKDGNCEILNEVNISKKKILSNTVKNKGIKTVLKKPFILLWENGWQHKWYIQLPVPTKIQEIRYVYHKRIKMSGGVFFSKLTLSLILPPEIEQKDR